MLRAPVISEAQYPHCDGAGLAELVRRGDAKATELLERAIQRASALDPRLNAIARAVGALRGAFAGVPLCSRTSSRA